MGQALDRASDVEILEALLAYFIVQGETKARYLAATLRCGEHADPNAYVVGLSEAMRRETAEIEARWIAWVAAVGWTLDGVRDLVRAVDARRETSK